MSLPKYHCVVVEADQAIATIRLNRPRSLNAMNRALLNDTADAFRWANQEAGIRVIVFTGQGRSFCAGDDRKEHRHPKNENDAREMVEAIQRVTREIVLGSKPVVGAINGWAVGGGFEWAINCDFPIWASSARGFFPEVSLNLFVTGAVTCLLPSLVGLNRAREMLMLGETYSARKLLDYGVAWKVVDDASLMDTAYGVARKIAALPEKSVQSMKRILNQAAVTGIESAMNRETEATVAGFMDPETTRLLKDFQK
jgi:enoyl-CoA hydratase/carnithine racemase